MTGYPLAFVLSLGTALVVALLLRSGRLREKYAAIWLCLGLLVVVLGLFPRLLFRLASFVGVETPSNLLFAVSLVVLLLVCIQLSTEISQLEEETRTLAEEHALLAQRVDSLEDVCHRDATDHDRPEDAPGARAS